MCLLFLPALENAIPRALFILCGLGSVASICVFLVFFLFIILACTHRRATTRNLDIVCDWMLFTLRSSAAVRYNGSMSNDLSD